MTVKIAINGFGRIGRAVARIALNLPDVEIVAINDLTDTATLAHLLKYDSVHGRLNVPVEVGEGYLQMGTQRIRTSAVADPEKLAWGDVGADVVLECTGRFTKRDDAAKHIAAGGKRVIVSAPAKGVDATIVVGVNDDALDRGAHEVISCASCTTNCLAPVAKVLHETVGIKKGLMTTIHAYTADQRLLDAPHKDLRRARSAALSMVPTSTGAAVAVSEVLPALEGRLNGMAIRVPTPNVSVTDLTFEAERATTADEINEAVRLAAEGPLRGILAYETDEIVSIDMNGHSASSIFDSRLTRVQDGTLVKILSWYDNEWGFSNRMIDLSRLFVTGAR